MQARMRMRMRMRLRLATESQCPNPRLANLTETILVSFGKWETGLRNRNHLYSGRQTVLYP
jgi:hypothetical protein